jgi:lipoprotein NlpD
VVAWVKAKPAVLLTLLLMGLVSLSGCGGDAAVAPVSKHANAKGSRWSPAVHTVSKGETLYSIAFQYGQDYRTLARRNAIRRPYTIYVGQKLKLRGGGVKEKTASTKKPEIRSKTTKNTSKSSKTETKRRKVVTQQEKKSPKRPKKAGPLRWHWPTHGRVIETFSSKSSTRKGIDIAGRLGQSVKAASAGRVVYSGSGLRGYGKLIIVKHNEQYLSAYAHNRKLLVKEGDTVKLGQRIAEMGRSGADRVKLHFEIRREGNPVNPMQYLPKRNS